MCWQGLINTKRKIIYLKLPDKRGSKTGKGVMLRNLISMGNIPKEAYKEKTS